MAIRTMLVAVVVGAFLLSSTAARAALIADSLEWDITVGGTTESFTTETFQQVTNPGGLVTVSPQHQTYENGHDSLYASVLNLRSYDGSLARTSGTWTFELDSIAWATLTGYWSILNDEPAGPVDWEMSLDGQAWNPPTTEGFQSLGLGVLEPGEHTFAWSYSATTNRRQAVSVQLTLNHVPEPGTWGMVGVGLLVATALRSRRQSYGGATNAIRG